MNNIFFFVYPFHRVQFSPFGYFDVGRILRGPTYALLDKRFNNPCC